MRLLAACVATMTVVGASAAMAAAQPDASLNTRVSIDHKNTPARDVLKSLANAASMQLEISDEEMAPVTITLTNARVRTALDAVCENAGCKWTVTDGKPPVLKVTRGSGSRKIDLKADISVHVKDASVEQALRTLASYFQVNVVIEGKLGAKSVNINVSNGSFPLLLDALCKAASCTWRFEPEGKRLVISAK